MMDTASSCKGGPTYRFDEIDVRSLENSQPFDADDILLKTDSFANDLYVDEFRRRNQISQRIGAYVYRNAEVTDGWMLVTTDNYSKIQSDLPGMGWSSDHIKKVLERESFQEFKGNPGAVKRLEGRYVLLSFPGAFTFGHVLIDISIRLTVVRCLGLNAGCRFLIPSPTPKWFIPFLYLAGISLEDCVPIMTGQSVRVEELYVPVISGVNGVLNAPLATKTFKRMKSHMDALLGDAKVRDKRIWPLHTTQSSITHPRTLEGREKLIDILRDEFGIWAFNPLDYTFSEQVDIFRQSKLVFGEDSSALHNVIWSDSSDLFVLSPRNYFNYYHIGLQAINGGRLAIEWGEAIADGSGHFVPELDSIRRTLEKMIDLSLREH